MAVDFKNKVGICWAFIKRVAARVWAYLKVAKMEWIVMIGVFAFDLISKSVINATIEHGHAVQVIPYFLNFHNLHNYNAAFGSDFIKDFLGEIGARIFFSVFAVAASVAFILVLIHQKGKSKWFRVALALFVAGAMGNCIDRMAYGYVRDFIEFVYFGQTWFGRTTWYVFNIADAALITGVIMIVIYFLFFYKDRNKKKTPEELTDELEFPEPLDAAQPQTVGETVDVQAEQTAADGQNGPVAEQTTATEQGGETEEALTATDESDLDPEAPKPERNETERNEDAPPERSEQTQQTENAE